MKHGIKTGRNVDGPEGGAGWSAVEDRLPETAHVGPAVVGEIVGGEVVDGYLALVEHEFHQHVICRPFSRGLEKDDLYVAGHGRDLVVAVEKKSYRL